VSDTARCAADTPVLEVTNLCASYGTSQVLVDVSLTVPTNGSLAVVGRNGAGKTTLVRTLLAHHQRDSGVIRYQGKDVANMSASALARRGIGYVPQEHVVFPTMTVRENLQLGLSAVPKSQRIALDLAYDLFPKLAARPDQIAGTMSGGERKMVGIARALLSRPRLLVMDEPTEGVWHGVVAEILDRLTSLADTALLVVEQHLQFALEVANDVVVLDRGRVAVRTTSSDLAGAPDVLNKYLTV